jgi:hypothetical protein
MIAAAGSTRFTDQGSEWRHVDCDGESKVAVSGELLVHEPPKTLLEAGKPMPSPPIATCPYVRGARTPASKRGDAGLPRAPPGLAGCGVPGSSEGLVPASSHLLFKAPVCSSERS